MSDQIPNYNNYMNGNNRIGQINYRNELAQIENMRREVAEKLEVLEHKVRQMKRERNNKQAGLRDAIDDLSERLDRVERRRNKESVVEKEEDRVTIKVFLLPGSEYIGDVTGDKSMKVNELEKEIHKRYGQLEGNRIYYIYSGTDEGRVLYDSIRDTEGFHLDEIAVKDGDSVYFRL